MNDNKIIEQLINDAREWGLEYELNEFINDNPDLTVHDSLERQAFNTLYLITNNLKNHIK